MKKSLSLFLTLTMTMVLSVSASSVVCAGTATPKASIEQGWIKPEKVYIKSTDLPAFALGNMKAADMVALTKYAEGGSPQFHQLNAKTHLWMNSEEINTVNRYKTNYEIAQEALAFQKNKLKKPYQDKIDEAQEKIDEAERKAQEAEERVAELEEKCQENPGVGSTCQQELEAARAEAERLRAEAEKTREEHQPVIDENQEKINDIDAAKDAEALGKVKANQDQDVADKKADAAAKKAAADTAEEKAKEKEKEVEDLKRKANGEFTADEVRAYCEQRSEGFGTSRGTANCAEYGPEEMKAEAEAKLNGQYGERGKLAEAEEARQEANDAKQAAAQAQTAADAAEQKIVDDMKNENERAKGILERQDRYGVQEETGAFSEVADVDEHVRQTKEEYYAKNAAKIEKEKEETIKVYQDAAIKEYEKNYKYLMEQGHYAADSVGKELEQLRNGEGIAFEQVRQNAISTVDANYRTAWEQEEATLRSNLQSGRDNALSLRDELAKNSRSSADVSGVKFGGLGSEDAASIQAEKKQFFLPSGPGVDALTSDE